MTRTFKKLEQPLVRGASFRSDVARAQAIWSKVREREAYVFVKNVSVLK